MSKLSRDIADWLRQQLTVGAAQGFAVGLSGGIDSAVVARLCQIASPGNVVGVIMPCHSAPADSADARLVADYFAIPTMYVDLGSAFDRLIEDVRASFTQALGDHAPVARSESDDPAAQRPGANLKARLRMSTLYFVANSLSYLVAGTGNRSELMIGYFTKHGDGGVDVLPLGSLLKGEVRKLARELEVPDAIIDKAPSAGLWVGQTDEQEMGFTYADLERYVTEGPDAVSPALAMRIERLVRASDHKRALAPIPDFD
ncbi:MAG: synthase [Acidobacteriota bacterium]